jgi:hypothetical protein
MEVSMSASGNGPPSQLRARAQEDVFCQSLPPHDPIAAQKLLCEALARLVSNRESADRQLGAVLVFDRHAHHLSRRLLVQYGDGDARLHSLDRRYFIAAMRLSRSFAQAYERFLGPIESLSDGPGHENAGTVLIQLFRHWEVELLLRLFRYKKRNSEQWRQFHAAFRTARARGLATACPRRGIDEDKSAPGQPLEQQFIQVLLLGAMNTGQFSPRELLRARAWIERWRSLLTLDAAAAANGTGRDHHGFVVDLDSAEGLMRSRPGDGGNLLHLDTAPLMAAIDREIAAPNDAPALADSPSSTEPEGRIALLSKLRMLFAPHPVQIRRRGDRQPVAYDVHAVSGLAQIVQVLRAEAKGATAQMATAAARLEEVTISPTTGHTRMSGSVLGAGGLAGFSIATTFGARPQAWQVKDRSDSGCRMRGQASDLNGLIPGSLLALREDQNSPWTVAVVRRLRRLMVDHVETSVEYIGRRPRFVKLVTDYHAVPSINGEPERQRCFGALYLPASDRHPTMPIKTLLVPASVFDAGRTVTLLSSTATYTLRLNQSLEQQIDFVWTSFAVLDKAVAPSQRMPGASVPRVHGGVPAAHPLVASAGSERRR